MENVNNIIANSTVKGAAHQTVCEKSYYAQPYNLDAQGFYFSTLDEYEEKANHCRDSFGLPVEEFEIMFIDGSREEAQLFSACSVNQANLGQFLAILEDLPEYQQPALFYLCDVQGVNMEEAMEKIDEVCTTEQDLEDYGYDLFFELYGHDIPESLHCYIDTKSFCRDLEIGGDVCSFEFAGTTHLCTNAACI